MRIPPVGAWPKSKGSTGPRASRSRTRSASVARGVDGVAVDHDAVVAERHLVRDEVAEHVAENELRVALERVAPAAGARGAEDEPVARRDGDLVDLRRELDDLARWRGSASSCCTPPWRPPLIPQGGIVARSSFTVNEPGPVKT